jgi:hypothetical protein
LSNDDVVVEFTQSFESFVRIVRIMNGGEADVSDFGDLILILDMMHEATGKN